MINGTNDFFDFMISKLEEDNPFDASRNKIRQTQNENNVMEGLAKMASQKQKEVEAMERAQKMIHGVEEMTGAGSGCSQFMNREQEEEPSAFCNSGTISKEDNRIIIRGEFTCVVETESEDVAFEQFDNIMENVVPTDKTSSLEFEVSQLEIVRKTIKEL